LEGELVVMEFVIGILSFVGDVISAWAISAWSYCQEKLDDRKKKSLSRKEH